jgi:hypothetical protein
MGRGHEPPIEACTKPLFYSVRRSQDAGGAGHCSASSVHPRKRLSQATILGLGTISRIPTGEHSLQLLLPSVLALRLDRRSLRNLEAICEPATDGHG